MAQGDITKNIEYDKIEVVSTWNIQVRKATKIMEEQADGSKKELSRSFHRHILSPFNSAYKRKLDSDGNSVPDLDSNGKYQWIHNALSLIHISEPTRPY